MSSLNKVTLIGNLGGDPDIRTGSNGNRSASFSLATTDVWRDKATGERREKTEWHRIVIFNEHLVKLAEGHLRKGAQIYLEGALTSRKFTGQDGIERSVTEIQLTQFKGELKLLGAPRASTEQPRGGGFGMGENPTHPDLDDEIPF